MSEITLHVKCSVVRSYNNKLKKLNWVLFIIFTIVSAMYFLLWHYDYIQPDSYSLIGKIYIIVGVFGVMTFSLFISYALTIFLNNCGKYICNFVNWVLVNFQKSDVSRINYE